MSHLIFRKLRQQLNQWRRWKLTEVWMCGCHTNEPARMMSLKLTRTRTGTHQDRPGLFLNPFLVGEWWIINFQPMTQAIISFVIVHLLSLAQQLTVKSNMMHLLIFGKLVIEAHHHNNWNTIIYMIIYEVSLSEQKWPQLAPCMFLSSSSSQH